MPRPTLDLCAIMKNEAHNLPEFMASFGPCVDKVILIDTGSTDDSVVIAEKLGAEVHHFKWINDFAAARNYAFSKGEGDFILWADLDDSLKDPEMFKLWRNEVMPLGDYHMATYHYAHIDNKPVCSFIRERVVRRDKQFKWNYFLHEGIKPESTVGPVRCDIANTWSIWHRRSSEDMQADRNRNLALFRGREQNLDSRMIYYYGKELFEGGFWDSSIEWLKKAITKTDLEPHDRILAYQYLGYAYSQMAGKQLEFAETYKDPKYNQLADKYLDDCVSTCLAGIHIDPNRAEFHVAIADCFIRQKQLQKAIPFLQSAASCVPGGFGNSMTGPVFSFADQYSYYPRTQLIKCFAGLSWWDKAKAAADDLYKLHPTEESKAMLTEIDNVFLINKVPVNSPECDDIVISCPPGAGFFAWDGKVYRESFCGGSETAAVELAENLYKLTKRNVYIFNDRKESLDYEGVKYRPVPELAEYLKNHKPWLMINWRHNVRLTDAFTILWCHDLVTNGAENHANYDKIACLTPFHKRYVTARQGIPDSKMWVTRNGLNPDKFKGPAIEKDPFRFVFSSSPDRGLDRAMLVLDKVRKVYPKVELYVHYGIEHLGKYGLGDMQNRLQQMMDERPWVHYIGKTSQADLITSFKKSAYCVQPSDFIETSMISAMERLSCGVYQIIRKVGGCVDTLAAADAEGMAKLVDSDCITETQYQVYVDAVLDAMQQEAYKRVKVDPGIYAWSQVAKEWVEFTQSTKQIKSEVCDSVKVPAPTS